MSLEAELAEKIRLGENLVAILNDPEFARIDGCSKLEKKVKQELKFLNSFRDGNGILKAEHLKCSNLVHLNALIDAIRRESGNGTVIKSILYPVKFGGKKLIVDVVTENGENSVKWIKVTARNPKNLDQIFIGDVGYGKNSFLTQIDDFISASKRNFQSPGLSFRFCSGISRELASRLERKGVEIVGKRVDSLLEGQFHDLDLDNDISDDDDDDVGQDPLREDCLNLDITTLVAYVSSLTNGDSDKRFADEILNDQAKAESRNPVKSRLDSVFENKTLICCESAMSNFARILDKLGGKGEKARFERFRREIRTIPDRMSPRIAALDVRGKIKRRSKAIFGTGEAEKVKTVTANVGFVRAVKSQYGIDLPVIIHESRALAEIKILQC